MLKKKLFKIPVFVYILVAVLLIAGTVVGIILANQSNFIKRNNTITLLYDRARNETIMMYNNEVRWDDESYVAAWLKIYDVSLTGDGIIAYNEKNGGLYYFNIKGVEAISDDVANFVMCDDGQTFAWCSNTGKIQLFNGVSVRDVSTNGSPVNFAISPNGKLLLYMETVNNKDYLKVYDTKARKSFTVAANMFPLSINNDGSVIYCMDADQRLWCINRDGENKNSYVTLGEKVIQLNMDHTEIMFYDADGKAYVADRGGEAYQVGNDKTQILLPDSTPVSYHVTTNLGYYVFVNGVKTFKNCLLIDGETTIKYMKSYDKITTIATGVTGASLSDDGDVLYYILDNNLYRASGSFKSSMLIDQAVQTVSVTPDGKKAFYITAANVLKCHTNGAILSLVENCGNVMVTPENGALFMCDYDTKHCKGTLYFSQDGVSFYKLSDKAYDCWVTQSGAYYTEGRLTDEEGKVTDFDVTIYGSNGDKNFQVIYQDVWDIYNYNYSY